jgi:adenylate kinase
MRKPTSTNVPDLIILGPQGSGKTTQAYLLAKRFGFALLGAGDALREIAREDTELGRKVRQTINVEGHLVQPELISEVIKQRVATVPKDRGLILDGYPRSSAQYALFKEFWPETGRGNYQVIFIDLPESEATNRLAGRARPDDTPAAIRNRLQSFYAETMPMIREMEADGKVLHVDGAPSIDQVHQRIVATFPLPKNNG